MVSILAIAVVGGIGALLATMLVLAERFISNYGDVEVVINDGEKKYTARGGTSLLESLRSEKIFIPSACGGRGTCAYCKVRVLDGGGPLLPTEEPYMDTREREQGIRLSCQVKVRNDIQMEIPSELLSIREYQCRCADITDFTYDIKQFTLKMFDPPTIAYKPGQYVQLFSPAYPGSSEEVYRAYSISSDPKDRSSIELIVRRVPGGIATTYLFDHLKTDETVRLNGPYGEFYLRDTGAAIVFIAGGSGIAPIKCMLHHMVNTKNERTAVFFFGVRGDKDIFLFDRMKQFEDELPNFTFVPIVAQPDEGSQWQGKTGNMIEVAADYLKKMQKPQDCEGYLCGSPGLINAAVAMLTDLGIPRERHFYDKFA
ncbi:MAG: 2Fe-2S iron-sulfur cluster binding domain-containing protein [candidate division WOR-3 bacterium]|nr:MAG: 2Fe-2S iron-sulfur cluster binding domain-containing protein [candidate division WOR-3 bacterium]